MDATFNNGTVVRALNEDAGHFGGWGHVDSVHLDRISYNLTAMDALRINAPNTLFFADRCHGFDGLLEKLVEGFSVLERCLSYLAKAFRRTRTLFLRRFENYQITNGNGVSAYPSPTITRAWAKYFRVLEWFYTEFDVLVEFMTTTQILDEMKRANDDEESLTAQGQLAKLLHEESELLKFDVFACLKLSQPIVIALMEHQSRSIVTVHKTWIVYQQLRQCYVDISGEKLDRDKTVFSNFLGDIDVNFPLMYDSLPGGTKSAFKKELIAAHTSVRELVLKNWGNVFVKGDNGGSWELYFKKVGDCYNEQTLGFFAIAAMLDPKQALAMGGVPSLKQLNVSVPWILEEGRTLQELATDFSRYYSSVQQVLTEEPEKHVSVSGLWTSATAGAKTPFHIGMVLARFGRRALPMPGGSSDVERENSTINAVVSKGRTKLSNERAAQLSFIRSTNQKRKVANSQRHDKKVDKRARLKYRLVRHADSQEFVFDIDKAVLLEHRKTRKRKFTAPIEDDISNERMVRKMRKRKLPAKLLK